MAVIIRVTIIIVIFLLSTGLVIKWINGGHRGIIRIPEAIEKILITIVIATLLIMTLVAVFSKT